MPNALARYAERPVAKNALNAMRGKESKAAVDYGPGMPESHCGICQFFLEPDACKRVAGTISPDKWCKLFQPEAT